MRSSTRGARRRAAGHTLDDADLWNETTETSRPLKMPKLWQLAKEGDLAGVEAAIKAGADLEEGLVRGMINRAHRLLAPPPSFGSVLHPHHPCLLSLTPPS